MKIRSLLILPHRYKKPVVTASMNSLVTIAYLEMSDVKNIKEIRLMADTMGERRK